MAPPLIEVCLDSADSAVAAQAGGAARVELCDNLLEGGTTPSAGAIAAARRAIDIGLHVMIRPRGGDFCYGPSEVEAMLHDIGVSQELGADGVVFGALLPEGRIDEELTTRLLEAARPLSVTFHRAFDMSGDPLEALDALKRIGVHRLLSSGQEGHVLDGLDLVILQGDPRQQIGGHIGNRQGDRLVFPAIINLVVTAPDTMEAGMDTAYGASAGQMTLYAEFYDSVSNQLIGRVTDPRADQGYGGSFQGLDRGANIAAENKIVRRWADVLAKHLHHTVEKP